MKSNKEVLHDLEHSAVVKTSRKLHDSGIKAMLAGIFISLGALGNIVISAEMFSVNSGVARFLGAVVFPVGLISIVILGLELFTSNCANMLGVFNKKISLKSFIRNIIIVYVFNFIGCTLFAYLSYRSHALSDTQITFLNNMANHKVHADIVALIIKGFFCNLLVAGAAIVSYYSENVIGKIFGIWFLIMLFILLGYSHSIANMFYLSLALFYKLNITVGGMFYNLFFVTIGNFLGGIFLVLVLNLEKK